MWPTKNTHWPKYSNNAKRKTNCTVLNEKKEMNFKKQTMSPSTEVESLQGRNQWISFVKTKTPTPHKAEENKNRILASPPSTHMALKHCDYEIIMEVWDYLQQTHSTDGTQVNIFDYMLIRMWYTLSRRCAWSFELLWTRDIPNSPLSMLTVAASCSSYHEGKPPQVYSGLWCSAVMLVRLGTLNALSKYIIFNLQWISWDITSW